MSYGTSAWRPWVLDEAQSYRCFQTAFELGFNFFDTADMYSRGVSEEVTGRAVREYSSRDQTIIATKAYYPTGDGPNDRGLSRKHLFDAIDSSLRRLGTDYIDLFQIHRWDSETPIEEIQGRKPVRVKSKTPLLSVALAMKEGSRGAAIVEDNEGKLAGIFTERHLVTKVDHSSQAWLDQSVDEVMDPNPKTIEKKGPE